MAILLLFLILAAILLPGLMRFFFAMIGLFVIVVITIVVAHAEPAGQDDVIIHDRTHYTNCTDSTYTKIVRARPPYYILLTCMDPHSDRVLPSCTAGGTSFCTMDDCDKVRLKFDHQWVEGEVSGMACGIVDEYGKTEVIRPTAQEASTEPRPSANEPTDKCNPYLVVLDSLYTRATVMCTTDYMDSKVGLAVRNLALICYDELSKSKINDLIRKGFDDFNNEAKANGKQTACKLAGQTQEYLGKSK